MLEPLMSLEPHHYPLDGSHFSTHYLCYIIICHPGNRTHILTISIPVGPNPIHSPGRTDTAIFPKGKADDTPIEWSQCKTKKMQTENNKCWRGRVDKQERIQGWRNMKWYILFGNQFASSSKVKHRVTMWPSSSMPKELKTGVQTKNMHMNAHSNTINSG